MKNTIAFDVSPELYSEVWMMLNTDPEFTSKISGLRNLTRKQSNGSNGTHAPRKKARPAQDAIMEFIKGKDYVHQMEIEKYLESKNFAGTPESTSSIISAMKKEGLVKRVRTGVIKEA